MKKRNGLILLLVLVLLALVLLFVLRAGEDAAWPDPGELVSLPVAEGGAGLSGAGPEPAEAGPNPGLTLDDIDLGDFRADTPFVELYNNEPGFSEDELSTEPFENYAPLDALGRCGTAYANLCRELMPTQERGNISQVRPSGWVSVRYDNVDGKSLYNRCHLIGWQLAGEDANRENLITGTRYMNTEGMLPFENMVADYIKETDNHVLYRVTPVFSGDNLVADGVQMEALSVEDRGDGICFNVFCYNAQPGIAIDYATGESRADPNLGFPDGNSGETATYVLNTSSRKFHLPDCPGIGQISEKNRGEFTGTRAELVAQGYAPCGSCKP